MEVSFTVPGVPAPQGSKTRTKWGVREDNPNTKPWRSATAGEAIDVMQGRELLTGPLALEAVFYFPRPKGHYGSGKNANALKPSAPIHHTSTPDADKLLRAIGDSLKGIVCRDDSQLAIVRGEKRYGTPSAHITVREIQPTQPERSPAP